MGFDELPFVLFVNDEQRCRPALGFNARHEIEWSVDRMKTTLIVAASTVLEGRRDGVQAYMCVDLDRTGLFVSLRDHSAPRSLSVAA
jgi:hypothetical protein